MVVFIARDPSKDPSNRYVMASLRRKFPRDIKVSALRRLEAGDSMREVARFHKIDASVLRRWRRDYEKAPESAFPGPGRRPRERGMAELRHQIERHAQAIEYLMQRIRNAEGQGGHRPTSQTVDMAVH